MKTLIISDLHLKWKTADEIINHVGADKIVFLGDYFDDFGDTDHDNLIMAEWLVDSLKQPNRIHLMGNHDTNYAFQHHSYKCSGYETVKYDAISEVLKEPDWRKLKLFTWVGSWLCSHAGVHRHYYTKYGHNQEIKSWIDTICKEAMDAAFEGKSAHPILRAGISRCGSELYGGIIWCDADEFVGIKGVDQVFGHTPQRKPRWINSDSPKNENFSRNLVLDVSHSHYYAIHDEKTDKIETNWIGDL